MWRLWWRRVGCKLRRVQLSSKGSVKRRVVMKNKMRSIRGGRERIVKGDLSFFLVRFFLYLDAD